MVLLGKKQFRFFVQRLLYTWQYTNLSTEDFLNTLKKEDDGEEIASVVESWINSSDLPKIMVQLVNSDKKKRNFIIKLTEKNETIGILTFLSIYTLALQKEERSYGNS